jgi:hypothetical protein
VFTVEAQRRVAQRLAKRLGGHATKTRDAEPKQNVNLLVLRPPGPKPSLRAEGGDTPGDPVVFTFKGNPELLLRNVPFGRFSYQVSP